MILLLAVSACSDASRRADREGGEEAGEERAPRQKEETVAQETEMWQRRRTTMVDTLRQRGAECENVLDAMRAVRRHRFIPEAYRGPFAYEDRPLPIGHDQTISQPYVVAYMTEAMQVRPGEKVLEIGAGSGYQAAVLAEMGAEVYTIEIIPELGRHAKAALAAEGYGDVKVRIGDGYQGWPEHAPFDVVIVTAAPEAVPEALVEQLRDGGRMIVPVGTHQQRLVILRKENGEVHQAADMPVRFVPMVKGTE